MLNRIHRFYKHCHYFSFYYVIIELLNSVDFFISKHFKKPLSGWIHKEREKYVYQWLINFLQPVINEYKHIPANPFTKYDPVIWTCWLQGFENAPDFVKKLHFNLKNKCDKYKVISITGKNYSEYCHLPDYIIDKYKQGIITPQQFTDIIRAYLLSHYGGLWIDSTVLLSANISEDVFSCPIYNVKNLDDSFWAKELSVDSTKWQSYFIASMPNSVTYSFIYKALLFYWERMETNIDYFLVFYLAKISRELLYAGNIEYEAIPTNNVKCELLDPLLLDAHELTYSDIRFISDCDTYVYKLSWKYEYPLKTKDNKKTLFFYINQRIFDLE